MEFVVRVYALTRQFPREEVYGLTSQLRRAAVGIPSNISEGHQRGTKAYLYFLTIAQGCLAETDTQIELARRLRLAPDELIVPIVEMAAGLGRLLHGLRRSLKRRQSSRESPDP